MRWGGGGGGGGGVGGLEICWVCLICALDQWAKPMVLKKRKKKGKPKRVKKGREMQ